MADDFERLILRLTELERRQRNMVRYGRVAEVDASRARVKVIDEDGGDHKLTTTWLPWAEVGGHIRTWHPPAVGQQVVMFSPSGNIGQAIVFPAAFSDQYAQPSQAGDEQIITIGSTTLRLKGDEARLSAPKIVLDGEVHLGGDGGALVHRKGDKDSAGDAAVQSANKVYAV